MRTEEVMDLLRDVAEQVIDPRFRALAAGEVLEKRPGDLVTVADREAEVLITEALQAAHPDAVVLGEEAYAAEPGLLDRYRAARHAFTVDPVDGTKNFVAGSPDHAVMVAELRDGIVLRSWIWQPQHRVAWVAERGVGVFRDGERIQLPPDAARRETLRGRTSRRAWIGTTLPGLDPMELTWVSCGIDYPRLCEDRADYVLYGSVTPWDHAPGSLMITEAGGTVGQVDGTPWDPQGPCDQPLVVATSRVGFDRVCTAFAQRD